MFDTDEVAMKIVLDRRSYSCFNPACEAHFGRHFSGTDITSVDCTIEMVEDGKKESIFLIHDKGGTENVLVVVETNRGEANDSWLQAWERQT